MGQYSRDLQQQIQFHDKTDRISNRFEVLRLKNMEEDGDDDYVVLARLTERANHLPPMARAKDREDEARVRFITKAVGRTKWELAAV